MNVSLFLARRFLSGRRGGLLGTVSSLALAGVALGTAALVVAMGLMSGYRGELFEKLAGTNAEVLVLPGPDADDAATRAALAKVPGRHGGRQDRLRPGPPPRPEGPGGRRRRREGARRPGGARHDAPPRAGPVARRADGRARPRRRRARSSSAPASPRGSGRRRGDARPGDRLPLAGARRRAAPPDAARRRGDRDDGLHGGRRGVGRRPDRRLRPVRAARRAERRLGAEARRPRHGPTPVGRGGAGRRSAPGPPSSTGRRSTATSSGRSSSSRRSSSSSSRSSSPWRRGRSSPRSSSSSRRRRARSASSRPSAPARGPWRGRSASRASPSAGAGVLLGTLSGVAVCALLTATKAVRFPAEIARVYYISWMPFRPEPRDVLAIAVTGLLLVLAAAAFPARRASRLAPSEALRYE